MNRPTVALFRTPRTGSTMVRRAIMLVADFPKRKCGHHKFKTTAPLIVTVRDWRDVLYSQWRIQYGGDNNQPTQAQIHNAMDRADKRLKDLNDMADAHPNYSVWRYEDTYNNLWATSRRLEEITGRSLYLTEVIELLKIVPTYAVLDVQDSLPKDKRGHDFNVHCKKTGIHKNHMGPMQGRPGSWMTGIPQELHTEVTEHYKNDLERWGYKL